MKTGGIWYLAVASLLRHKLRTTILVATVAVVAGLPLVTDATLAAYTNAITARARTTPILLGPRGGETDLLLDALYLRPDDRFTVSVGTVERAVAGADAQTIALHVRHRVAGFPLVGTELGYFGLRGLRCDEGRLPLRLGDCVVGAEVAARLEVGAGDTLLSDPEGVLDVVGGFGTRLRITGVLAPNETADDRAVFCDVKTAWVIDGIGHGHDDVDASRVYGDVPSAPVDLPRIASVDDANLARFHFHGDPSDFPLRAAIVVPATKAEGLIVRGRFADPDSEALAIVPTQALDQLLEVVMRIEGIVRTLTTVLAVITAILLVLIGILALRLRRVELATLGELGVRRGAIVGLIASEWTFLLLASAASAAVLLLVSRGWVVQLLERLIAST
ncbi:MAG: ABC transporter permease [Planctomycetota bacterium]